MPSMLALTGSSIEQQTVLKALMELKAASQAGAEELYQAPVVREAVSRLAMLALWEAEVFSRSLDLINTRCCGRRPYRCQLYPSF
jgi:NaMN:DMB phosphoribosyltransferase